jgi:molecular chaperone GrpE
LTQPSRDEVRLQEVFGMNDTSQFNDDRRRGASPRDDEMPPSAAVDREVAAVEEEIGQLRRDLDELGTREKRLIAEMRNLQQRHQREKEEALRYAEFDFARELLVVVDDFERVLEAAAGGEGGGSADLEGVRIAYDHMMKVLRQRGIAPIEAVGRPFDPHFHEALVQQPAPDQAPGTVLKEVQRGYTMHQRVLRPTRVIVAGE